MTSSKVTEWGSFIDMHVHLPANAAAEEALFEALIEQMTAVGLRKIIVVNTLHGEANRCSHTGARTAQRLNACGSGPPATARGGSVWRSQLDCAGSDIRN